VPFAVYRQRSNVRAPALRIAPENVIFVTAWTSLECDRGWNGDRITPTRACPSCGKRMRFARAIAQADGLPELQTYDCKGCGVAMTEAEDSQLASPAGSVRAPIIGALLSHGLLVSTPEPQPVPNTDRRGTAASRRRF
jgi:hypothetical protein